MRHWFQAGLNIIGVGLLIILIATTSDATTILGEPTSPLGILLDFEKLEQIVARVPASLELLLTALLLSLLFGRLLVSWSQRDGQDGLHTAVATLFAAAPVFWLGATLLLLMGFRLELLPTMGRCSAIELSDCPPIFLRLEYLIMPALSLAIPLSAHFYYELSLASRGFTGTFRFWGKILPFLFSYLVVVETAFGWPGIGRLTLQTLYVFDLRLLISLVFAISTFIFLVSALLANLAPREVESLTSHGQRSFSQTSKRDRPAPTRTATKEMGRLSPAVQAALNRLRLATIVTTTPSVSNEAVESALRRLSGSARKPLPVLMEEDQGHGLRPVAVIILVVIMLASLLPFLGLEMFDSTSLADRFLPVGSEGHILGTDDLGRDTLGQLLLSGQVTLGSGLAATFLAVAIGGFLGLLAGQYGELASLPVQWLTDFVSGLPLIPVTMLALVFHRNSLINTILILGLVGWTAAVPHARRHAKEGNLRAAPWLAITITTLAALILLESNLGFLGLGAMPPRLSWGGMSSRSMRALFLNPLMAILPGLLITLTIWSLLILGRLADGDDTRERR